jgi:hypothetical protein
VSSFFAFRTLLPKVLVFQSPELLIQGVSSFSRLGLHFWECLSSNLQTPPSETIELLASGTLLLGVSVFQSLGLLLRVSSFSHPGLSFWECRSSVFGTSHSGKAELLAYGTLLLRVSIFQYSGFLLQGVSSFSHLGLCF